MKYYYPYFNTYSQIINAYLRLIAKKRSTFKNNAQFHIFDTMFFAKLNPTDPHDKYDFLQFSDYFDKQHYKSPKYVTQNSVFLFMINNEERDYALIACDVATQKFILYDCQQRNKETFLLHVKKIKQFMADYFDCFPPQKADPESEYEYDMTKLLRLESVADWKFEAGLCPKMKSHDFQQFGSGIFVLKIVDYLTQCRAPYFDINELCTISDLYKLISVELISSKLLVYT